MNCLIPAHSRDFPRPGELHPIGQPAKPCGMNSQHVADFRALGIAALAAGKPFQLHCRIGLRLGQLAGSYLRAKAVEKLDEDFEIVIHFTY